MHFRKKKLLVSLVSASLLMGLFLTTTKATVKAAPSDSAASQIVGGYNSPSNNKQPRLNSEANAIFERAGLSTKSLISTQIQEINKINFDNVIHGTGTQWTYHQYGEVARKMISRDDRYRVPYFNVKKIKNMPATHTRDAQTGKKAWLDIWDSWPVQDARTSRVVNYKGYQLAVAMMGIPLQNDSHIYLLYNKYNDNNFNHWKCAGPIFGFNAKPNSQEWSGSATVNKDGSIELFFADVDTSKGDNNQRVAAVNLVLKVNKKKNRVRIAKTRKRHIVFAGDGYHYQTYKQWKSTNKGADNIAMRDAHVVSVGSHRYLAFEASTGLENYQGSFQKYNWQNYGGTDKENFLDFLGIIGNGDMSSRSNWANAALGILELNGNEDNPKVKRVMTPLITSPMVSDEIERPDIIKMNGKYYLFATTRLNRGTNDNLWHQADSKIGDNVAMLGWVSDHLTYGYKPLNGDAGILTASVPFNWRTATYSYYAVPIKGHNDEVLVTSYMTNRGYVAGKGNLSTWAPSFIVKINPNNTTEVTNKGTNQGVWNYNRKSLNKSIIVSDINEAK